MDEVELVDLMNVCWFIEFVMADARIKASGLIRRYYRVSGEGIAGLIRDCHIP